MRKAGMKGSNPGISGDPAGQSYRDKTSNCPSLNPLRGGG